MEKKIYGAYGSNINLEQMARRCPSAEVFGVGYINGYRLTFRRGGFANIEKSDGDQVPVLLWIITDQCEEALDFYEGYPRFYTKTSIPVVFENGNYKFDAMFYIMNDEYCARMEQPTSEYYYGIQRGYKSNGMPIAELKAALDRCMSEVNGNG